MIAPVPRHAATARPRVRPATTATMPSTTDPPRFAGRPRHRRPRQPPRVQHPGRERRVRAQEADEQRCPDLRAEDVALDGEGVEQPEDERAGQVHEEDAPREAGPHALPHEPVHEVARDRAGRAADGDEEDGHGPEHAGPVRAVSNGVRPTRQRYSPGVWTDATVARHRVSSPYAARMTERPASAPIHDVAVTWDVRDPCARRRPAVGESLAACRRRRADRVPAILEMIPYGKDNWRRNTDVAHGEYWAARGYAFCRLDVRGTGSSGGVALDEYTEAETLDGYDAVEWLAAPALVRRQRRDVGHLVRRLHLDPGREAPAAAPARHRAALRHRRPLPR